MTTEMDDSGADQQGVAARLSCVGDAHTVTDGHAPVGQGYHHLQGAPRYPHGRKSWGHRPALVGETVGLSARSDGSQVITPGAA